MLEWRARQRPGRSTMPRYLDARMAKIPSTPRGFERLALNPCEIKKVTTSLGSDDPKLLDGEMHWNSVRGTLDIMLGGSSADLPRQASLEVNSTHGCSIVL